MSTILENKVIVQDEDPVTQFEAPCYYGDGTFYYCGETDSGQKYLYHVSEQGEIINKEEINGNTDVLVANQSLVVLSSNHIQVKDHEKLSQKLNKYEVISIGSVSEGETYDFIFTTQEKNMYGVSISDSKVKRLFQPNSLNGYHKSNEIIYENNTVRFLHNAEESSGIYIITEGPDVVKIDKVPIYIASRYPNSAYESQLVNFNLSHPEYELCVLYYGEEEDPQKALSRDILNGKQIDLFDLTGMKEDFLIENGVLADLYPYLDDDPKLERADIFESVLSLYERDGKMYTIIPCYFLLSMLVDENVLDSKSGWGYEAMWSSAERNVKNSYSQELLYYSFLCEYEHFVDTEKRECYFDDGTFEELLNRASKLTYSNDGNGADPLVNLGSRGFTEVSLTFRDAAFLTSYKGGSGALRILGYPDTMNTGNSYIYEGNKLAIAADTKYPEIVWEFARQFLTEDYQVRNSYQSGMFATNRAAMERLNKTITTTEVYEDP